MRRPLAVMLIGVATLTIVGCGSDATVSTPPPDNTGAPVGTGAPDQPDAPVASTAPDQPEVPVTAAPDQPDDVAPAPVTVAPASPNPIAPEPTDLLAPLLGLGLLVLAGIVVVALLRHHSKPDATPRSPVGSPQANLLTTAQWIHDQLSLELLAAPPADALQRWNIERSRLDDVAIAAQQQWVQGHGDAWSHLSQTMTALASCLDTNLRLRAQRPVDPALVAESAAVVTRQRAALMQVVAAIWPTVAV